MADARVAPVDDDDDDLHDTGHSLHFLARLERIDGPQTDLALRLYRDSALVRAIAADPTAAAQALAPEQRVAIALAAGAEPPLVIVTAGGAFVTCLAAGMAPSGARVVPWERVCIHVGRADREAARTAEAEAVLAAHGGSSMLRRLLESGALVSREGMQQMMAVEPLLGPTYTRALYEMLPLLPGLADRASRCRAGRRGDERTLRRWFDGYYALSHLLILSAASGYDQFSFLEERTEQQRYDLVGIYLSFVDLGHAPLCNAALWAIARAGKVFLPALQRALAEAEDVHSWLAAAFGLQAVAFAHERLRSEAARSFGGQGLPAWMASDERLRAAAREMRQITERRPTPEETAELRRQSAEWMHASLETIDPDDRIGARRAWSEGDRAPVEAIYTAYLTHLPGTMMQTEVFTQRLAALPVLVRAEPEDLCWPAAVLPHFGRRYDAAHARLLAAPWAIPAPEPVRAIPKPGRNDSCSCGSAKKYKRCCGAA